MKNDYPLFKNLKIYGLYDQLSNDEMDYVFSGVFKQPVKVKGYGYESNGLGIFNENGNKIYFEYSDGQWVKYQYGGYGNNNRTYWEDSDGYWEKREYDNNHNEIYYETSDGEWYRKEYDENGNIIYREHSDGVWYKYEYDENGNKIYEENSYGEIINNI